jgi:FHA domain
MKLELSLENTNNSWPLTPDRVYIAGSDTTCDLTLPVSENVRPKHLKFAFDKSNNCWSVEDLSGRRGTIVNNALVAISLLRGVSRIVISDSVVIIATPEFATAPAAVAPVVPIPAVAPTLVAPTNQPAPNVYMQPNAYMPPNPNTYNAGYEVTPINNVSPSPVVRSDVSSGVSRASVEELRVLSWPQYVEKQSSEYGKKGLPSRWNVNFALKTGLRNTPWMKKVDGYIIPDFKGSVENVSFEIEKKLGLLRQYEGTDCYVSSLTDAHLANSETQSFLGIELFPVIRSRENNQADYRRFCVTAYHRVRTYLLVEKYGEDLFVSWITRFEPMPTPAVMVLWLVFACILTLVLIISTLSLKSGFVGLLISILPILLWWEFYSLLPTAMSSLGILPKKSNARLITGLIFFLTLGLMTIIINSAITRTSY